MPSARGLGSKGSFKLGNNPVFNRHQHRPPSIQLLNSSGESNGGSSETCSSSIDEGHHPLSLSAFAGVVEETFGRRLHPRLGGLEGKSYGGTSSLSSISSVESDGGVGGVGLGSGRSSTDEPSCSPYEVILNAMETDPKWRSEKSYGKMVGMYKLCGEIGAGNFAKVRLGIHQLTREKVAVKVIDKTRLELKMEKMMGREVSCMEALSHPNIVRLYEVIETTGKLFLISEWAPGGDLYAKVSLRGRLTETEAKPIFRQILSAITYMHASGIIHRDLKAENIFFATGTHCKVGDFGFATSAYKGHMLSTFCGSPPYAAPELFRDESYEGAPVDIWALGILLYFVIEGNLPFIGTSIPSLKRAILEGLYSISDGVSLECSSLIHGILVQRPSSRHTLSHIIRHPWLQQIARSSSTILDESSPYSKMVDPRPSCSFDDDPGPAPTHPVEKRQHELIRRQDTTSMLLPATKNRALSKTIPTRDQVMYGLVSVPELRALEILKEIGISNSTIDLHRPKGVRSHVVGIYRIVLHKVQQGRGVDLKGFAGPWAGIGEIDSSLPQGLLVPPISAPLGSRIKDPVEDKRSSKGRYFEGRHCSGGRYKDVRGVVQQSTTCSIL